MCALLRGRNALFFVSNIRITFCRSAFKYLNEQRIVINWSTPRAEKKCKTKINNRKVTKLPTAKLIEIAVANCKHGHNFIEILHVSCKHRQYFQVEKYVHTKSAIAGYWLGSVMNHNRSEGKYLWFPPTNPSQENGKSPKFSNNCYKMSKTLHILKHECYFFIYFLSFIDVISCRCRSQRMPLALQCVLHWVEWSELSWGCILKI